MVCCAGHKTDDGIFEVASAAYQSGDDTASSERRIQALDSLQITVFNEPDLTLKATVSADGTISYPLLQSVELAGLTVREAEAKLTELLGRDYLVSPSVTVAVERGPGRHVYLMGEIETPGSLEIPVDEVMTLVQAISRAGGFTDYAAGHRVTLIRRYEGKSHRRVVDVSAMIHSGDLSRDILLCPEDVISVPPRMF
jgi:polysaccharide export outer membrane protein